MRRSFISGSLGQLVEARGCCKPSPDPPLVPYLRLPLLSCYQRCCFCLGSQPAPGDAVPAQPGPGNLDLLLPGCVSAGTRGLAAASMLETRSLPSSLLPHPGLGRKRQPRGCQLRLCATTCVAAGEHPAERGRCRGKERRQVAGYKSFQRRCETGRDKQGTRAGSRWALCWVLARFDLDLQDHEVDFSK